MSDWHAVTSIEDAYKKTKNLLFEGFRPIFWVKLVFVVVLAEAVGQGDIGRLVKAVYEGGLRPELVGLVSAALAFLIFSSLVMSYVAVLFQFIFVRSLLRGNTRIYSDGLGQSLNALYVFLLELAAAFLFVFLGMGGLFLFYNIVSPIDDKFIRYFIYALGAICLTGLAVSLAVFYWIVGEFLIPLVAAKDHGLIEAVKRLKQILAENVGQFTVYVTLRLSLGIFTWTLAFLLSFALIFAAFSAATYAGLGKLLGLTGSVNQVFSITTLVYTLSGIALMAAVTGSVKTVVACVILPIKVFYRYYSLVFLSKVGPDVDLFTATDMNNPVLKAETDAVKVY